MKEIANWKSVDFNGWDNIKVEGRKVNSFFGKTFFYYDKENKKLYYENLNIVELLLHAVFGYKREFNRENLWEFLKSKKIIEGDCPNKKVFRQIVGQTLRNIQSDRQWYADAVAKDTPEDVIIDKFKNGMNVNLLLPAGRLLDPESPALWQACMRRKYKVAEYLINNGADVNARYEAGYTAYTPFHVLLEGGNVELANYLAGHGLDLASKSYDDKSPLHLAIEKYDSTKSNTKTIIQTLLTKNADVNATDKNGKTPLCYACEQGDMEIVQWLVDKGANVNAEVKYGRTPLNIACSEKNVSLARYLLDKGASIEPSKDPATEFFTEMVYPPLLMALNLRSSEKPNMELINLLIESGADVNQSGGEKNQSPLHVAAANGLEDLAKFLVANGANKKSTDIGNRTPADLARQNGHATLAELLKG